MHISQIMLTNWKAYKNASFDFPEPTADKNIILIGAQNGFGKTSFFQAILLGMYGKDGFDLMEKSPLSIGSGEQGPYPKFIKGVLHKNAAADKKYVKVQIKIVDEKESPVEIIRTWHFSSSGEYRVGQDEVQVFEGYDRSPVGPLQQNDDREAWYRDYIAREFLPSNLSSFFWFDGEKASIFAEKDMASQVKSGITNLLGIPVITELAHDLQTYASNRRQETRGASDTKIDQAEKDRDVLKTKLAANDERLSKADPELTKCKYQRDTLTAELAQFGARSQDDIGNQHKEAVNIGHTIGANKSKLNELLANDMALALSGSRLRKSLDVRLTSENVLYQWQTGKQHGDSQLDKFIHALDYEMGNMNPSIDETQRAGVVEIARTAWKNLWYPPPQNCATEYRHPHLNESDRGNVRAYLQKLAQVNAPVITKLLDSIDGDEKKLNRLRSELDRLESARPHLKDKQKQLQAIHPQITKLEREVDDLDRESRGLKGQLDSINENLGRLYEKQKMAKPVKRRITNAMSVAKMIDEIVTAAVPSQTNQIAEAMTVAYKNMAHKAVVEKIKIDEQCNVNLLDVDGNNVRDFDASAGEKQIFTQALISAVSSVWGRAFPVVIDTPIARLDQQHRQGLLAHLANRGQQVILLSTDTEVVSKYLHTIEANVQKKYLIKYDEASMGSTADVGYFPSEANP